MIIVIAGKNVRGVNVTVPSAPTGASVPSGPDETV